MKQMGECPGCGKVYPSETALRAHQNSRFVASACKPVERRRTKGQVFADLERADMKFDQAIHDAHSAYQVAMDIARNEYRNRLSSLTTELGSARDDG